MASLPTTSDSSTVQDATANAAPDAADPALAAIAHPPFRLAMTVCGMGTAVAMWAVGYLTHLRPELLPGWITFTLLAAVLVAGSVVAARRTGRGAVAGAWTGFISSLVNLLILGSLVSSDGTIAPAGLVAIPGSIAAATALGAVAGAIGGRGQQGQWPMAGAANWGEVAAVWRHAMVLVTVGATFFVVIAGGLVTSTETGLAVPDWPNTYGSNMFLYPLSKMTGGVYYEHAHRLYGSLVGLSALVTLVVMLRSRGERGFVRGLAAVAFVMVCVQGTLGGLRVTGSFTTSQEAADLAPNLTLAIVHGVFGQVFFATMVALAVLTSPSYRRVERDPADRGGARVMTFVLLAVLAIQLISGAAYRHLFGPDDRWPWASHLHLTWALVALAVALGAGISCMSRNEPEQRPIRRVGIAMCTVLSLQLVLGVLALAALMARPDGEVTPPGLEVLATTAHQANGALVLAAAAMMFVWTRRLPTPTPEEPDVAPPPKAGAKPKAAAT